MNHAADLYWLAYLLTGGRAPSVDSTIEALDFEDDARRRFSAWMMAWSRKIVIAKALAAVRGDLAASALRTRSLRVAKKCQMPTDWRVDPATNRIQLERALLGIDLFPRCAVVLSIFERLPADDAVVLLDCDLELLRKGQMIGLHELTRNLARMQDGKSAAFDPVVLKREWKHA
jgi:hypothetical protein